MQIQQLFSDLNYICGYSLAYFGDTTLVIPEENTAAVLALKQKYLNLFTPFKEKNRYYIVNINNDFSIAYLKTEHYAVFVGPVKFDSVVVYNYHIEDKIQFLDTTPPVLNVSNFLRQLSVLARELDIMITDSAIFGFNFVNSKKMSEVAEITDTSIINNIQVDITHKSFDQVNRLEECVRNGNLKMSYEAFQENISVFENYEIEDLELAKYMTVSGLTIITRAAIKGGVHYALAYQLSDTYLQMIREVDSMQKLHETYYQAVLQFTKLSHDFHQSSNETNDGYYVIQAKKYIDKNPNKALTVQEIAEELHITPNYLSNIFKKATGKTVLNYINEVKISIAKKMLNYSNYSLVDISLFLGYASQSHFTKRFKDETGMTPKQYLMNLHIDNDNEFKMIKK